MIVRWPGVVAGQQLSSNLVDASDFLPTLAQLAGTRIPDDWHHDGQSFVPSLLGTDGPRRESCFFWYDPRPGWDKEKYSRHIFALDHKYKLFSDGRFFDIAGNGLREVALNPDKLSTKEKAAREKLQQLINKTLQPPISPAAGIVVDAFGDPVK